MKKFLLIILAFCFLLSACRVIEPDYFGEKYPPTTHVDIFYSASMSCFNPILRTKANARIDYNDTPIYRSSANHTSTTKLGIPFRRRFLLSVQFHKDNLFNNSPTINIQEQNMTLSTGSNDLRMTCPRIRHAQKILDIISPTINVIIMGILYIPSL